VYGMFGLAVIVLTVLSLGGALLALARHQLPENRWRRGLRFLTPGLGVGLFAVFTLSAMRVLVPRPGVWIPILLVTGGGAFLAGYLTPSPDDEEENGDGELDGPPVGETAEGALER
jgi:peptidoglycan/LPS O-acetylase OafA/YrhL